MKKLIEYCRGQYKTCACNSIKKNVRKIFLLKLRGAYMFLGGANKLMTLTMPSSKILVNFAEGPH